MYIIFGTEIVYTTIILLIYYYDRHRRRHVRAWYKTRDIPRPRWLYRHTHALAAASRPPIYVFAVHETIIAAAADADLLPIELNSVCYTASGVREIMTKLLHRFAIVCEILTTGSDRTCIRLKPLKVYRCEYCRSV